MKLTDKQIDLGAKYLGIQNLGHMGGKYSNERELKASYFQCLNYGEAGEYDGVMAEIDSFRKDLKSKKKSKFFIEMLQKELPWLFEAQA